MGAYQYTALDKDGQRQRGVLEGESERSARQQIRARGLYPVAVESLVETRNASAGGRQIRLSAKERELLTAQLATLLRSGLPLEEALESIAAQCESRRMRRLVHNLRSAIREGQSLSQAIARHPASFDRLYLATVEAGEASGHLDQVLAGLVDYLTRKGRIERKTQVALIYPVMLTLVSILVVVGLMHFVVPEMVVVFEGTGQRLPLLTELLMDTSELIETRGHWMLLTLLGIGVLARLSLRVSRVRDGWHRLLLALPLIGRLLRTQQTARLLRTLAILNGSGVPLLDSLRIAGGVLDLMPYQQSLQNVYDRVREGEPLHRSLARSHRFPPIALNLIASGERSGNLAEMLANAADDQENELTTRTEILVSLFEPLMILVMGGLVLMIVLAMLLPVFEMNQLVG